MDSASCLAGDEFSEAFDFLVGIGVIALLFFGLPFLAWVRSVLHFSWPEVRRIMLVILVFGGLWDALGRGAEYNWEPRALLVFFLEGVGSVTEGLLLLSSTLMVFVAFFYGVKAIYCRISAGADQT